MNISLYLEKVSEKIEAVEVGYEFELSNLLDSVGSRKLGKGERIQFGQFFAKEVRKGNIVGIVNIGKTKSNHTIYKKV